jgi:NADH dehydrogenase
MATIGRNRAVVELPAFSYGGFPAWLTWLFVHLLTLVGFRNKIIALSNWAWNYLSYDRGMRLIIPLFRKDKDPDG